jgi:hypothetical protein
MKPGVAWGLLRHLPYLESLQIRGCIEKVLFDPNDKFLNWAYLLKTVPKISSLKRLTIDAGDAVAHDLNWYFICWTSALIWRSLVF